MVRISISSTRRSLSLARAVNCPSKLSPAKVPQDSTGQRGARKHISESLAKEHMQRRGLSQGIDHGLEYLGGSANMNLAVVTSHHIVARTVAFLWRVATI